MKALFTLLLLFNIEANAQTITAFAGNGTLGYSGDGGPATAAQCHYVYGVAVDSSGNVFIVDEFNHCIRKVNTAGIISTIAGLGTPGFSGDGGPSSAAQLNTPNAIAIDQSGNIFISDNSNSRIRKINSSGIITTVAGSGVSGFAIDGGPATAGRLNGPTGIAVDLLGNIFIAESSSFKVRKINTAGIISTIGGNGSWGYTGDGGPATLAKMASLDVAVDRLGNVYCSEGNFDRVRIIRPSGIISTFAGNGAMTPVGDGGLATAASVPGAWGIVVDNANNVFIAGANQWRLRKVDAAGIITTVAGDGHRGNIGDGGPATAAEFLTLFRVAFDRIGNLYIADQIDHRVRKVTYQNHRPRFVHTHPGSATVCQNSVGNAITTPLAVMDSDATQTLTWSMASAPAHGSIGGPCYAPAIGDTVSPTCLYYTPTTGYSGTDNFKIRVTDGIDTDTMSVSVTITPVAATTGSAVLCPGNAATFSNPAPGGVWSSSNTSIATVGTSGTVRAVSPGTALISYTLPSGCSALSTAIVNAPPSSITGATLICNGSTTTLSNAASGGTWSSSNTAVATIGTASGLVTGVSAGITNITYTAAPGCFATLTFTVVTAPSPIAGSTGVCVGATTILSDPLPGGTWSSSATGVATVLPTLGAVTGVSSGTSVITYSIAASGCFVTTTVYVAPLPGTISGTPHVCSGNTTTLTSSIPGGTWASSNTAIATALGGVVQGVAAGTSLISYALGTGCTATAAFTVYATPPAISGVSGLCLGNTAILSNTLGGGTWASSNTSVVTIAGTGTIGGASVGSSTITYTITATGCYNTKTVTVNTIPPAPTGTATICAGSTTTLSDAAPGGAWASSNTAVATIGTSGVVQGAAAGTTTISYSVGTGCMSSIVVTVKAIPAAVSGASGICIGSATTLSSTTSGGIWLSSNTAVASIGATGITVGLAAGTATITYTISSTGCFTTKTVAVNTTPPAPTGTSAFCLGTTSVLSDATGGGTWSSSNTAIASVSSTGVVAGLGAGTANISYTLTGGCNALLPVTIFTAPPAITGTAHACPGTTTTLSNAMAGGAWTSGDAAIASISTTGTVGGVSDGTTTITYTVAGCYAIKTVTVDPLPGSIAGTTAVCVGATTPLYNPTPGGTWSTAGLGGMATVIPATGVVSGLVAGPAMVSYTLSSGCAVTAAITVLAPPPSITGTTVFCAGRTSILTDPATGGTWSSSNTAIASVVASGTGAGTVSGIVGGTATISYSLSGCTATRNITVNRIPGPITGITDMCAWGSTMNVYNADTPSGYWGSTSVTISTIGLVTSHSPGLASIMYSLPTGCSTTATVNVNPLPLPVSGATDVCIRGLISLFDPSPGGTWRTADTAIATTSSTGVVTGVAAGRVRISYTLPTGCTATSSIAVADTPDAGTITGPADVCPGNTITLTESVTGGIWGHTNFHTNVVSGIITGNVPGADTILYAVSNICGTTRATKIITVLTPPDAGTLSGNTNVCASTADTLTTTRPGGTWSSSNTNINIVNGIATGITPGSATVTYLVTNTCGISTAIKDITILAQPYAGTLSGPDSLCPGQTTNLTATAPNGTWSSTNTLIAGITSMGALTAVSEGAANIIYSVTNTCGTATASKGIYVRSSAECNTGIATTTKDQEVLHIWPNPSNGNFVVEVQSPTNTDMQVSITSITGISLQHLPGTTNHPLNIKLTQAPGIYLVSVITAAGSYEVKVVIR